MKDVAEKAGVSLPVVSTVLSGRPSSSIKVSPHTAARVVEVAKSLGYVPNSMARSLAVGRKQIIGVFTYERLFSPETVDHYSPFLFGIEQECENLGYDLLLVSSATSSEQRRVISGGANRLDFADGGILFGVEPDRADLDQLRAMGYPYVFIGRRETEWGETLSVNADYAGATRQLVERMLESGHRRFAYVGLASEREYARDRESGFTTALSAVPGAEAVEIRRGDMAQLSLDKVSEWFQRGVSAYVAETPRQAERIIELALATERRLVDDYSLVVLTDVHYEERADSRWGRLIVPRVEMGRSAVGLLEAVLDSENRGDDAASIIVACEVVFGESIGQASSRNENRG